MGQESLESGHNPEQIGESIDEKGRVDVAQIVVQFKVDESAFCATANGSCQIKLSRAHIAFFARAAPLSEFDFAVFFNMVGLIFNPFDIGIGNAAVAFFIVFFEVFFQRNPLNHKLHMVSLHLIDNFTRSRGNR